MIFQVNFLAVLVAAIINLVLGWIWYSPKLIGQFFYTQEEIKKSEKEGPGKPWQFIACFVEAFILSWALAVLFLGLNPDLGDAVITGLIVWFGFIVTTLFSGFIWGSLTLSRFLANALFNLVYLVIISLVIGSWQ